MTLAIAESRVVFSRVVAAVMAVAMCRANRKDLEQLEAILESGV